MRQSIPFKLITIVLLGLASSCNNQTTDQSNTAKAPVDSISFTETKNTLSPIWDYDYDADTLIRIDSNLNQEHSVDDALEIINTSYAGKVKLIFVGKTSDTLRVKIDQAEVLTEQMGTTGARAYMMLATFTLTEQTGFNYVTFDFNEGDHAIPGTYSRFSFENSVITE